jgi:signal transduction histidine kinase/DNA-binding response OmpR family regulator
MWPSQREIPVSVKQNYLLRITTYGVIFLVYLSLYWGQKDLLFWSLIIANSLLYPHIAYRVISSNLAEHRLLVADAACYGLHLAIWGFNPYLISVFSASVCVTYLAVGGVEFFWRALCAMAVGMVIGGTLAGWQYNEFIPLTSLLIVSTGFILYMSNLGYIIFKINTKLRVTRKNAIKQQDDLLTTNRLVEAVNATLDIDTIMQGIMDALQRHFPFESLYILPYSEDQTGFVISGIYGASVTQKERDLFLKMEFQIERDKDSIFVKGLVRNRIIYLPDITPTVISTGTGVDQELYAIKPSRSIAYFPISVNNQVIAGAAFINYETGFRLEEADLVRISGYLMHAGSALRNLYIIRELSQAKVLAEEARHRAEKSEEAKGRFLANISHEIRTPLTAVLGYAEALQEKQLSETEREKFVTIILQSGQHLLAMINDILDIAKIEAGKITLEKIPVSLVELLSNFQSFAEIKAGDKNLKFSINILYPIPQTLITDPTRLKQILFNLLNNAIKFTLQGSVTLQVAAVEKRLELSVIDTGIGIDPEHCQHLFSAFTQADTSTTRVFGGTGLGLFISQNLAQLMGGQITLASKQGVGSEFRLAIPLDAEGPLLTTPEEFAQAWQLQAQKQAQSQLPKLHGKILIAEDNPENQQLICRILRQLGLDFDVVNNGAQALARATQQRYDLLLFDLQMPFMGGKEAAEVLIRRGIKTPIIAFTANVMSHQKAEYEAIGFAGTLEKPFNKQQVAATLQSFLARSQKPQKILVVDDDGVNQLLVSKMLKSLDDSLQIVLANHGAEALTRIGAGEIFDAILMDMQMPVLDGLSATEQLRQMGCQTPIYILSANTAGSHATKGLDAGANGYIEKPINKQALAQSLGLLPQ